MLPCFLTLTVNEAIRLDHCLTLMHDYYLGLNLLDIGRCRLRTFGKIKAREALVEPVRYVDLQHGPITVRAVHWGGASH